MEDLKCQIEELERERDLLLSALEYVAQGYCQYGDGCVGNDALRHHGQCHVCFVEQVLAEYHNNKKGYCQLRRR